MVSWQELDNFLKKQGRTPAKTLLHYRTAGPNVNLKAYELEKRGYRLINPARVLDRTSDKYKSYEWAHGHDIVLPITKKGTREMIKNSINTLPFQDFVLKPINSKYQGALCFSSSVSDPEIDEKLSQIPGEEIILQEFVEYFRIYRVIVIGKKALKKAVFYDEPNTRRWKVSVCLNPEMRYERKPDPKLLSEAKHLADIFESEIAFIDVFETKDGYILSEINTACNLTLHEQKSGYDISGEIAKYLASELNKIG